MTAESEHAGSTWEFLSWTSGALFLAARLLVTRKLRERPLAVTLISAYLACFSGYVFLHTALSLDQIHESWSDAWFPVLACICVCAVPAIIAYGLWTSDELARKLAIGVCLLDAAVVLRFAYVFGWTPFRAGKLFADVLIPLLLSLPAVTQSFRSHVTLDLSHPQE